MKLITIRDARKRLGWTQVELAKRAGVDQTTISDLETGRSANPTFAVIVRVAKALGRDPQTLRFGSEQRVAS